MTNNIRNINNIFYIFVLAHLIFWTLVPSLTNQNLPLDTIEALAWGSNLEWGFNKHPPMSAFFPEVFFQIFGSQDWAYYFLSQIFVIISFYYVFKFSKEFFNNDLLGLISVLLIEAIYFYNSLFTTTNTKGHLIQVNTKGTVSRQKLGLDSKHDITSSSKTLVTRSDNKLSIKSNSVDLEYGSYTPPYLFYLRDKIYVSITDLQAQKIWMFDSQAKLFPSVPVFGTSAIDLANADADAALEFVTKGDSNSLIMYQLY